MDLKSIDIISELQKYANQDDAMFLQRFFKTGKGQYGEGDVFIGVRVPQIRSVTKKFKDLSIFELEKLVASPIHEHRFAALIICTDKFKRTKNEQDQKLMYDFYLKALKNGHVNNWDLIDVTCPHVVGSYLLQRPRDVLYKLARSKSIWDRRVSVLATFMFIKHGDIVESLKIAEILLRDKEDLIHKAVGWMLRELGKSVDQSLLIRFLDRHAHEMPRTMLRYSIEKLSREQRTYYLGIKETMQQK